MSIRHSITGFDRETEWLVFEHPIPAEMRFTFGISPSEEDPELMMIYPITEQQARGALEALGESSMPTDLDWFVEAWQVTRVEQAELSE